MEQENREVVYKTNISVTALKQSMLASLMQVRYCTLQEPNVGISRPRVLAITNNLYKGCSTASVVSWSEFLAIDPEVPGSIPGATRFSEK
jgi:hypothetical protein